MFLIFDTETNGKIADYNAPAETFPRIIQLAFKLFDENRKLVMSYSSLIKPDGWTVPKEQFWIENGFSTEQNEKYGEDIEIVLANYLIALHKCQYRIAHNISFDSRIIKGELIRQKFEDEELSGMKPKICTMMSSTNYCKLLKANGKGAKWPKLQELYFKCFNKEFEGAHDAMADVTACAESFFHLLDRSIIDLNEYQTQPNETA